jgi:hypothetical protein
VGAGIERCLGLCGGETAIDMQFRPGGIGPYTLSAPELALGPRLAPRRHGSTSLTMVCGLEGGCRGSVRLGLILIAYGKRHFENIAQSKYQLAQGEARRIQLQLSSEALADLHENPLGVLALAGPAGAVQARRAFYLEAPRARQ